MSRDLNLTAMVHFEATARLGGVTRAAEELGISASAVSQQLRALEQQMGVQLFRREGRRLVLTLDGERLFQASTGAFRTIRDVRAAIQRQRQAHLLSIRTSPSFGVRRLARFAESHPDWDLRIDAAPDFSDFETESVDLDLRYGIGNWPGLVAEPVLNDLVLPLCAPGYLARLRAECGPDPADLIRAARLIDSAKAHLRWDGWVARMGIDGVTLALPYRFDRSSMSIQMARDGMGVVLESATLAMAELAEGSLVPLSPAFEVLEFPAYWLVCPTRQRARRAVRAFADWIGAEAARHTAEARARLTEAGARIVSVDM
ncbi:LysR substrate-binding domain-containing protein [Phaeovulum vinaykumarii]|uniref:DNA-binding transcriptional regulator, LysR family n=1 Tax=Phaeovulum vinaykumarii TaxID=407234 RepID=A0A1N7M8X4_9RHOB|nr:LysR substrate-binding domain-containing protein [Phaeovulum vinaykumarii]SIS82473.1 DNA-binding transcriptional regulator, LysR family [Phaeovulum vinaykumarii]SOC10950.1 DNA-binding transcriptional LysR family regulator [Phaeovulum vinaykumarii]